MTSDTTSTPSGGWSDSLASRKLMVLVILLAMIFGMVMAALRSWLTDDAFISFRYARNLVEGLGLVFNPGERVEGMTNLLWTLWCSLGLVFHVPAETWSRIWGVAFYAGTIGLLGTVFFRLRDRVPGLQLSVPIAALAAAAHTDLGIYATGGLETAAFAFLALAGYVLLIDGRPAAAGVTLGLASLTRPDGLIFALIGGLYLLWAGKPRFKTALLYAACYALLVIPVQVWRVVYYGDFFPNTYYAKSAYLSWWSQGWHYLRLYFFKYWVLLPGLAGVWLAFCHKADAGAVRRPILLAAAMAIGYTLYVTRVGGDFMFARLLIPATPFYLILLEFTIGRAAGGRPVLAVPAAILVLLALVLTPCPVSHVHHPHGITNEWMYRNSRVPDPNHPLRRDIYQDRRARILGRYLKDLPVRVAFLGDEARVMYKARIHTAIESTTGLTDRVIARRKRKRRGWVGHEKPASEEYLVAQRKTHFVFGPKAAKRLKLGRMSLCPPIFFDDVRGLVLHWDPGIMQELERRGARILDPRVYIDNYLADIDNQSDAEVAREYARIKLFYFDQVDDPGRQEPFLKRLKNEE